MGSASAAMITNSQIPRFKVLVASRRPIPGIHRSPRRAKQAFFLVSIVDPSSVVAVPQVVYPASSFLGVRLSTPRILRLGVVSFRRRTFIGPFFELFVIGGLLHDVQDGHGELCVCQGIGLFARLRRPDSFYRRIRFRSASPPVFILSFFAVRRLLLFHGFVFFPLRFGRWRRTPFFFHFLSFSPWR